MNKLILKLAAVIVAIFATIGLTACTDDTTPRDLNGTYVYTGDGSAMVGEVKDGTILINLQSRDDSSLYWSGDFAKTAMTGDKVVSNANKEQLSRSMTGSVDPTKEFTIDGDTITFQMSAMGMTKTVELKKNSSSTN